MEIGISWLCSHASQIGKVIIGKLVLCFETLQLSVSKRHLIKQMSLCNYSSSLEFDSVLFLLCQPFIDLRIFLMLSR